RSFFISRLGEVAAEIIVPDSQVDNQLGADSPIVLCEEAPFVAARDEPVRTQRKLDLPRDVRQKVGFVGIGCNWVFDVESARLPSRVDTAELERVLPGVQTIFVFSAEDRSVIVNRLATAPVSEDTVDTKGW